MKKMLITSYDMEVGGVERSLLNLLEKLDTERFEVDVMLHRHKGEFMDFIPLKVSLLPEDKTYATFRKSIKETFRERHGIIGTTRLVAKIQANKIAKREKLSEPGYVQMQLMWRYALSFLPAADKNYDLAVSYLWPHHFVAYKVNAKRKIAWIHTDFSTIGTLIEEDLKTWKRFDLVVAVSEECKEAFLTKYPSLREKTVVLENLQSVAFIREHSKEIVDSPMLKDTRFKLLTVARLSHAKGIDQAVKAMHLLKKQGRKLVWYVVGYGGDEEEVRKLIKKYGLENDFILLGKQINPYPFMRMADLYVQPSRYEGKAVTVGEALILGKAVLITDYPTAKSQVVNMVDGYICENGEEGLAEGIKEMMDNSTFRNRLIKNCQKKQYENQKDAEKLFNVVEGGEENDTESQYRRADL